MKNTFTDLHNQALTMGEHIEQMREAYEALVRERDALAAHVERLSELLIATVKHWDSDDDPTELHSFVAELNAALNGTPTQSLDHIKAQVEEETIERCSKVVQDGMERTGYDVAQDMLAIASDEIDEIPRKYAKQAGPTVEEGE